MGYGSEDLVVPVIYHRSNIRCVDLVVELQDTNGKMMDKMTFKDIELPKGNSEGFRFRQVNDRIYVVRYDYKALLMKIENYLTTPFK